MKLNWCYILLGKNRSSTPSLPLFWIFTPIPTLFHPSLTDHSIVLLPIVKLCLLSPTNSEKIIIYDLSLKNNKVYQISTISPIHLKIVNYQWNSFPCTFRVVVRYQDRKTWFHIIPPWETTLRTFPKTTEKQCYHTSRKTVGKSKKFSQNTA